MPGLSGTKPDVGNERADIAWFGTALEYVTNHVYNIGRRDGARAVDIAGRHAWMWNNSALKHKAHQVDDICRSERTRNIDIAGAGHQANDFARVANSVRIGV